MVINNIFKDSFFQTICCEPIKLHTITVQHGTITDAMIEFAVSSDTVKLSEFLLPDKRMPEFKDAFYVIRCMLTLTPVKTLMSIITIESDYPEAAKELHLALDKNKFKEVMLDMSSELTHHLIDYVKEINNEREKSTAG